MSAIDLRRSPSGIPLGIGIAGIAVCGIGAIFNPVQFFRSYLIGYLLWLGVALGCLAILMLYHMVGGRWGFLIRRILEAATRTFPLLAVSSFRSSSARASSSRGRIARRFARTRCSSRRRRI